MPTLEELAETYRAGWLAKYGAAPADAQVRLHVMHEDLMRRGWLRGAPATLTLIQGGRDDG
jgi:hypothetical protein